MLYYKNITESGFRLNEGVVLIPGREHDPETGEPTGVFFDVHKDGEFVGRVPLDQGHEITRDGIPVV